MKVNYFCGWLGGWLGGWLENWRVLLIPAKIVDEVEVEFEIGKNIIQ